MKSYIFYILISVLILLIPFCEMFYLDTMVTEKYQIEHGRTFVEMDKDKKTHEQTQNELNKIDKLEREVHLSQNILTGVSLIALISVIVLLLKRKTIITSNVRNI